jgi:TolB-like protein/DNA-binding winged helix-turn-helix (wHTH) protein
MTAMEVHERGFRLGDREVRPAEGIVVGPAGIHRLGPRPMSVLVALAERPGKVVTRNELMALVWSGVIVSDETLSRCISDLRQALGDDARTPRYIETLSRRGYRLLEPPHPVGSSAEPEARPGSVQASDASPAPPADPARPPRLTWPRAWLSFPLALLFASGAWFYAVDEPGNEKSRSPSAMAENGLVVLPFASLSDDPELEYFSDGLTEELINRLTGIGALSVIARTSAFSFKDKNIDVRDIGRDLGVAYALEGSVRRQGGQVRIAAQLIDVRSGFHLFSRVYERPFEDIFAIQEHVALEVGAALEPRLAGIEVARHPPETSAEALEPYLLGVHLQRKLTVAGLQRSARELRRAIELDPAFARAHGALASTLALSTMYTDVHIGDISDEIESLIERALVLDPRSSSAWHARGLLAYARGLPDDAIEAFAAAHKLEPGNAGSLAMQGRTLYWLGRNREAVMLTRQALEKDPLNLGVIHNHAAILTQLGEYGEAERWLRRAMETEFSAYDPNTLWTMAGLKYFSGHHADAVNWYELCIESGNVHSLVRTQLGWVLLEQGEFERSGSLIREGLASAADPLRQLDSLLAWHYFQGDLGGLAQTIQEYDQRFATDIRMPAYRAFAALLQGEALTAIREYESLAGRDSERLHNPWDMLFGHWHAVHLARALQMAGREDAFALTLAEAERRLTKYERQTGTPSVLAYQRAAIASLRGEKEAALEYLQQAHDAGWRRHAQVRHDPLFDGLRDDERLESFLGRVRAGLGGQQVAQSQ